MPRRKKNKGNEENIPQGPSRAHDPLRKRIRKHVADPKDKITDEDIRNVKVEAASPLPVPENVTRTEPSQNLADEKEEEKKHLTPWDLLSED